MKNDQKFQKLSSSNLIHHKKFVEEKQNRETK